MALKIHNNLSKQTRFGMMNHYFVEENDGLTVIDTNIPGSAGVIIKGAQKIGKPIRRIVLTHAHNDHVGSLDTLVKELPEVEVIISEREAALLAGDMSLREGEAQSKLRGGYVTCETKPTRLVNEGDMIASLQVIAAPGHTPGHIALLDTRDQSLIAGDAFATLAGIVVAGKFNLLFPLPAMATWSKALSLETAKKLLALQPKLLAVGHGQWIEEPEAAMRAAIEKAEEAFAKSGDLS